MKNYTVTLTRTVNMSRDIDLDTPETRNEYFEIQANSPESAIDIAKSKVHYSIWESDAYEN